MHAAKRQAELGRDPHQGALIAASRFADHGAAALRPGPPRSSVMAATVLAIRRARPALSAMSSQSFETSTPMIKGLQQRKDRLKPTVEELPWRTFRKKGKVL